MTTYRVWTKDPTITRADSERARHGFVQADAERPQPSLDGPRVESVTWELVRDRAKFAMLRRGLLDAMPPAIGEAAKTLSRVLP